MAQFIGQGNPVGFITSVTGQVSGLCVSRDLQVQKVALEVGDPVYAWDQLQSGPDSALEVGFVDGSTWILGPGERVEVNPLLLGAGDQEPVTEDEPLGLALETGVDFDALEPTAAGEAPSNDDGTRIVLLDRGNASDPYQAFDTPGFETEGRQHVLDLEDVVVPENALQTALAETSPLERAEFEEFEGGFGGQFLKTSALPGGGGSGIGALLGGSITSSSNPRGGDPLDPPVEP